MDGMANTKRKALEWKLCNRIIVNRTQKHHIDRHPAGETHVWISYVERNLSRHYVLFLQRQLIFRLTADCKSYKKILSSHSLHRAELFSSCMLCAQSQIILKFKVYCDCRVFFFISISLLVTMCDRRRVLIRTFTRQINAMIESFDIHLWNDDWMKYVIFDFLYVDFDRNIVLIWFWPPCKTYYIICKMIFWYVVGPHVIYG